MPVSMIAITTSDEPVLRSQASGASISASIVPPDCPVLCSPHKDAKLVSFGKVVWATDTDPLTQEVGIEFHEIDPEAVRLMEDTLEPELTPYKTS